LGGAILVISIPFYSIYISIIYVEFMIPILYSPADWSAERRLQREQRELKTPQERSDEEAEAVPAENVRSERKSAIG